MILDYLKPTEEEIRELAEREVDPANRHMFEPICRGPAVAVLLIAWACIASLPHIAALALRRLLGGRGHRDHGV